MFLLIVAYGTLFALWIIGENIYKGEDSFGRELLTQGRVYVATFRSSNKFPVLSEKTLQAAGIFVFPKKVRCL